MIAVLQRVNRASVVVGDATVGNAATVVGAIGRGLLVLACVHREDGPADVEWTAAKIASLRLFPGEGKAFDRDVREAGGAVLLVSNFTVAADCRRGRRPTFEAAAAGDAARRTFDALVDATRRQGVPVETGAFGADMTVTLENDGPATFVIESPKGGTMSDERGETGFRV